MYMALSKGAYEMNYKRFKIIKEILLKANKDFRSKEALEITIKLNKLK